MTASGYEDFIGKSIIDILEKETSPGIIIIFEDGSKLVLSSGARGGFHAEVRNGN
jgi:hypothetical protein